MKIILHFQFICDNVGVSSLPQRKIRNMIRDHLNHWKTNALLFISEKNVTDAYVGSPA